MAVAADELTIRPLRRDEIGALAAAIVEMSAAQRENRWREQEMGFRELLVAESGGELVGTVSISENDDAFHSMHLFALEVAPARRGRGLGTALVEHVLADAERRGCGRVYLEVRVDNPARRLYHRLGFRRVGRTFTNAWWQFETDGSRRRIEEPSLRMVRRLRGGRANEQTR